MTPMRKRAKRRSPPTSRSAPSLVFRYGEKRNAAMEKGLHMMNEMNTLAHFERVTARLTDLKILSSIRPDGNTILAVFRVGKKSYSTRYSIRIGLDHAGPNMPWEGYARLEPALRKDQIRSKSFSIDGGAGSLFDAISYIRSVYDIGYLLGLAYRKNRPGKITPYNRHRVCHLARLPKEILLYIKSLIRRSITNGEILDHVPMIRQKTETPRVKPS